MSVQIEILVRVVGSQQEPRVLSRLTASAPLKTEQPFGRIPVSRETIAMACETAAEALRGRG
ncbi:hypothetical protein HOT31_gp040 [Microbacterium phage Hendrix]|uniref:Uncharacterized protein n=1 Tax=Microbacterium phage Hendrix TaxID=2182341 RepID=A0A2U8UU52_9CAUD|nr:hypothetical protein HOT31_gp040 [Microbacterium phage Hendrix]AWN07711.1 hypothetical protein PBI_HENDRIX_40 [Microbacterium phage Hendrix]